MIIIEPTLISDAQLISSNVLEEAPRAVSAVSYAGWNPSTTYAANAQVCAVYTPQPGIYYNGFDGRPIQAAGNADPASWLRTGEPVFSLFTSKYANNLNYEPGKYLYSPEDITYPGYYMWTESKSAPAWDSLKSYAKGALVGRLSGSIGAFYTSLTDNNLNNDPVSSPSNWQQTTEDSYATYNSGTTYAQGARAGVYNGQLGNIYESLQPGNLNHTPESSPTWWRFIGVVYKLWFGGTTYSTGDRVSDLRNHHVYEALQASTGKDPTLSTNSTYWLDLGLSNRWSMYDLSTTSTTKSGGRIETTVQPAIQCDGLALMGLRASQVWVNCWRKQSTLRNLLTYTEQFNNAFWVKASGVTVTADDTYSPDGTKTADKVNWSSAAVGTGIMSGAVAIGGAANLKSVWVRSDAAGGTIELADGNTTVGVQTITMTTLWQRVQLAEAAGAQTGNGKLWLRKTALSPASFHVWGAQLALETVMSSYQKVESAYLGFELQYNQYFNMSSNGYITDWRHYFFDPKTNVSDLIVTDLPLYSDYQLSVVIDNGAGVAECAAMLVGKATTLGGTVYGATTGITDYSQKKANEWGDYSLVERSYAKRGNFKVAVDKLQSDAVGSQLNRLRATPVVYQGTGDFTSSWIFGFFRDYAIAMEHRDTHYLNIEIEGLT